MSSRSRRSPRAPADFTASSEQPSADATLARGLNTHDGRLTNAPVAAAHGYQAVPEAEVLGQNSGHATVYEA